MYFPTTLYHVAQYSKNRALDFTTYYLLSISETFVPHCTLLCQTLNTTAFSKDLLFLQLWLLVPCPHTFWPIKACQFNFMDKSLQDEARSTCTWRAQNIYQIVQTEHNDSQMFITAGTEKCTAIANSPCSATKQFWSPGQQMKKCLPA